MPTLSVSQIASTLFLSVVVAAQCHAGNVLGGLPNSGQLLDRQGLDLKGQRLTPELSARDAIAIAEKRYGGQAVGARPVATASGTAYRVRILQDNGKIKNVIINNP